jgi:hypothetical protein
VITSCGALEELEQIDGGFSCLGLLDRCRQPPGEMQVLEGQGRLDWPSETVAIVPDQRGALDFPCHRWQSSAAAGVVR